MMTLRTKILIGIALFAFVTGVCAAIIRGFWGVSQDCDEWAKDRGCLARSPAGDQIYHSEELRNKASGWAWQFAIFTVGTLPAATIVTVSALRSRRNPPDDR